MGLYNTIAVKLAEFSEREAEKIRKTIDEINRASAERAERMNVPIRKGYSHSVRHGMVDNDKGGRVLSPREIRAPADSQEHALATRALNAIFLDHEINEAEAVLRGNMRPTHAHADPSVLMGEAKTVSRFPENIRNRMLNMRMRDFSHGEDVTGIIRTGKKPDEQLEVPALESALIKHMHDGSETAASIYGKYKESDAELRSPQYLGYVRDMVSRAAGRIGSKRESNLYTRLHDKLHPDLRYDIDKERDTAKGIYSKAWKKVPAGASIGALLGIGSGAALGGALSRGRAIPSIASAALGAVLGGTAGGVASHKSGASEGIREKYMGNDRRRPGSGG